MKKFLLSFLGTMAGIWLSIGILMFGLLVTVIAAGIGSDTPTSEVKNKSILHIDLSVPVTDRAETPDFQALLLGDETSTQGLNDIVSAILASARDKKIRGIYLDCSGANAGIAQLKAILTALKEFKAIAPEKVIYAYSDAYSQGDYYLATAADSIFLNPIGQVDIHGLASTSLYFKDLMDKLGVEAQVVKVGTYKSAVEPYLLNGISEPAREQQRLYLGNIWNDLASQMAEARGVDVARINSWADSFISMTETENYIKEKIVDRLVYRHELNARLASLCDEKKKPRLITPTEYCSASNVDLDEVYSEKTDGKKANIAVLYATGDITESAKDGIASDRLVPEILDLAENEDIDGLILRVNSGGGSAFASEQIWEALEQFKAITGKPFYVSMGDVAASGGYYISCGADRIFAEPVTLTGSIGIFGIIPNAQKLLNDKLGIHTSVVATNPEVAFRTPFAEMTPAQAAAMQAYVDRGYELFTSRCAEGRGVPVDSIKKIAEGRVWDGSEALRIGLVDEMGGLAETVRAMARELNADRITVSEYPSLKPDFWTILFEAGNQMKASAVKEELGPLYPAYRSVRGALEGDPLQCRMEYITLH